MRVRTRPQEHENDHLASAPTDEDTAIFVGRNSEAYVSRFAAFNAGGAGGFIPTWHWPAFFLGPLWLLYRKIYGWAALALIPYVVPVSGLVFPDSLDVNWWACMSIGVVISAAWALVANHLYYRHAKKKIRELKRTYPMPEMQKSAVARSGGVYRMTAFSAVVGLAIISNLTVIAMRNHRPPGWQTAEKAYSYRSIGRYEEAIALMRRAPERHPSWAPIYYELAHSYLELWITQQDNDPQLTDKALERADWCVDAWENSIWCQHASSRAYLWRKQHDKAIEKAEKVIAIAELEHPKAAGWYGVLGEAYCFAGMFEQAIEMAEKAASSFTLGHAYRLAGRLEDAVTKQKQALTDDPMYIESFSAHLELAILYSVLGSEEEAGAEAAEILKMVPGFSVEVWGQRIPYKDQSQIERDMTALRKAGLQ